MRYFSAKWDEFEAIWAKKWIINANDLISEKDEKSWDLFLQFYSRPQNPVNPNFSPVISLLMSIIIFV